MSVIRDLFTSSVNSTMMSINERFTYLQKNVRPIQTTVMTIRANNSARQQASAKNRRLAMQMESRLSAMAALKIKKKSIRQRLGVPMLHFGQVNNVRDRLSLPGHGKGITRNKRNRGSNLRRASNIHFLPGNNLRRNRSVQSLNEIGEPRRSRSRSRSRPRGRAPSVGPMELVLKQRSASAMRQGRLKKGLNSGFFNQQLLSPQKRKRSNSMNFRNRRAKNIGNQGVQKEQKNLIFRRGGGGRGRNGGNVLQVLRRQGPFGGGRGGRGRGRGDQVRNIRLSRNGTESVPTKEELDKELEQYMANTKSQLDKDIDSYMKENVEMAALRN